MPVPLAVAISVSFMVEDKDIFDKLVLEPTLKTFVRLVVRAGMVENLKAEGPMTVFAPNDAAFARVPVATMTTWQTDKVALRKMISLQIVKGNLMVKDFKAGLLKTISGDVLVTIGPMPRSTVAGNEVRQLPITIGGSKLYTPDIEASNGTLHIVSNIFTLAPPLAVVKPTFPPTTKPESKPPAKKGGGI